MAVSNQPRPERDALIALGGPRARTARLMLETASAMMQQGVVPSVTAVAEAASVSRATAYRYFPTQADLVEAVIDEALGPILTHAFTEADAAARLSGLLDVALPRIAAYEATFRAALKLSLDCAPDPAGEAPPFRRGHRVALLRRAVEPLVEVLGGEAADRLAQSLSLVFGVEAFVVLRDIWGMDSEGVQSIVRSTAAALLVAAAQPSRDSDMQLVRPKTPDGVAVGRRERMI